MGDPPQRTALEVLIVEDDEDLADSLAEVLRRQGHRPVVLADGERALRRLAECTCDLLICDVRLPGADGVSILRRVKGRDPDLPVILMSAYGPISEAVGAVRGDVIHYLEKPFSIEQLVDTVGEVERVRPPRA